MSDIIQKNDGGLVGASPASMISEAIKSGADLENLEKLLELQQKWEANEARKAYHKAMAAFKENPPRIEKDKKVGYSTSKGNVGYSHATLANVTEKISCALSKHGLSASWTTKQNGKVVVTCKITHELGHSEETALAADADTSGSKNPIQAIGSTISYLERYTLLALTGLATYDQDDDGKAAGTTYITKEQAEGLRWMLVEAGLESSEKAICEFFKVEELEKLDAKEFKKAEAVIKAKAIEKRKKDEPTNN